ncbi:MAG: SMI1/KNR4 family protein [Phycisphaeraceae bacterium]|nr:SMI1/KNR4 family protein [Phycisphaeraceae bacterium]
MPGVFGDFDFAGFWEDSEYALEEYVGRPLDSESVRAVEHELGFKLPASYIEFMSFQNGGIPHRRNHRTTQRTMWAYDHIAISGLYSIGSDKGCSLCGQFGNKFWTDEWGYPLIGVYFADCPSAGHDMVCLDYSKCGPQGEPRVTHVDQEWDYRLVVIAKDFESFIRGLENNTAFE